MAKDPPKVIGILLCERVLQDATMRDAITCVNIHNSLTAQSFPATIPLIYAFAQLSGSHNEFSYQFKIIDRQNQIIATSSIAMVEPLPNHSMTHKIITAFTGLIFNEEGTYKVCLGINGEEVGFLPFLLMRLDSETKA